MTRYMIDLQEELGLFPKRIRVGKRAVFWSAAEVDEYIRRLRERGTDVGGEAADER